MQSCDMSSGAFKRPVHPSSNVNTAIGQKSGREVIDMVPGKLSYLLPIIIGILFFCCGKPSIKFHEVSHDFGILEQHSTVEHIFKFVNSGNAELLIKRIKSG